MRRNTFATAAIRNPDLRDVALVTTTPALRSLQCGLQVQGMDKIMERVVKDTHFFINTELGNHLPVIKLVSFLEQIPVSSG